eukprot:gnl/TRDRNA2_/TRDRNA2_136624_c1_seq1.p1 gnl/TRDRNA2_/TRDRNA2_136624_c1~~gnl/TRDRNA2_/TRDRNA2_136624_c1_seq1.p1  ORF type:complete len:375 (-),score=66.66 gnl/TRDRNA2_/TRDRNA2_136624_c1_seq1:83-1120(-)
MDLAAIDTQLVSVVASLDSRLGALETGQGVTDDLPASDLRQSKDEVAAEESSIEPATADNRIFQLERSKQVFAMRFAALDTQLSQVIGALGMRLDRVESLQRRPDALENSEVEIDNDFKMEFSAVKARLDRIESGQAQAELATAGDLMSLGGAAAGELMSLDTRLSRMEQASQSCTTDLSAMDGKICDVTARMGRIETSCADCIRACSVEFPAVHERLCRAERDAAECVRACTVEFPAVDERLCRVERSMSQGQPAAGGEVWEELQGIKAALAKLPPAQQASPRDQLASLAAEVKYFGRGEVERAERNATSSLMPWSQSSRSAAYSGGGAAEDQSVPFSSILQDK